MHRRDIDPTPWLRNFNLHHGIEVKGASRILFLSGQTATAGDGAALHPGDLVAQFKRAWGELCDALLAAEMGPANIVRLNIYTTDMDAFMAAGHELSAVWAGAGAQPTCTLLGVTRLFQPELMVELEATAVA